MVLCPDLSLTFLPAKLVKLNYLFLFPIPWTFLSSHDEVSGLFYFDLGLKSIDVYSFFPSIEIKNPNLLINLLFQARKGIIFQLCEVVGLSPTIA